MKAELVQFQYNRFGMFVHWGIYAAANGQWQGMDTPWLTEWIMRKFRIPRLEYRKFAEKFTADNFDADRWIKTLKDAGMKYIVITAKHHDGFAMFRTTYDDYNICDATPFGRDPLKELADACEKYGIRLGFYYSHEQDWNEPGATGNTWDFPAESKTPEAFEHYLQTKVRHQIKELLTNYGKIFTLWLDTPQRISEKQSVELLEFIRELAPDCLINSRIGNTECGWDFRTLPDNHIPRVFCKEPSEAIGTMNESWGYKPCDHNYRSSLQLLNNLGKIASCGANYMLNVGPDAHGNFPPEALDCMRGIGEFLAPRTEALYGSYAVEMELPESRWGHITRKDDRLFFWCFTNPGEICFYGLRNRLKRAYILTGGDISFAQEDNDAFDYHKLQLNIPSAVQPPFIICAECGENLDINIKSYDAGRF